MDEITPPLYEVEKPKKSALGRMLLLLIPLAVLAPIWFFFIGPKMRHDRLVDNGVKAKGRLLDVSETGTVYNDVPELALKVEYTRKDGKLDTASTDFVSSLRTIHMFQPGAGVRIAYDSADPHEITIEEISDGPVQIPAMIGAPQLDNIQRTIDSITHVSDSMSAELQKLKKLKKLKKK